MPSGRSVLTLVTVSSAVAALAFLGGPGTALFIAGAFVFAGIIGGHFGGGTNILLGVIGQFVAVALFWTVLSVLGHAPLIGKVLQDPLRLQGTFSALPFQEGADAISRVGSIVALGALPLLAVTYAAVCRHRHGCAETQRFRLPTFPIAVGTASLLPFVVIKLLKPENLLAATMSGDARNHFLIVQQARATSLMANFFSPGDLASPRFPHGVAALISASNGTTGVNQSGDQWAVVGLLSVCLFMFAVAGAVAAQRVINAARRSPVTVRSLQIGLILPLAFTPTIPYALYPVLADGFLTLFMGSSVLAAVAVAAMAQSDQPLSVGGLLALGLSVYVLALSYPFLIVPGLLLCSVPLLPAATRLWRRSRLTALSGGTLAVLGIGYSARLIYPTFAESASLVGSVTPRDDGLLVTLLVVAVALSLAGRSRSAMVLCAVITGTLASAWLIERVPGNEAIGYSYYSTKVIIGGAAVALVLLPSALLSCCTSVLERSTQLLGGQRHRRRALVALVAFLIGIFSPVLARGMDRTETVQRLIWSGWSVPSPESISTAVASWGPEPTAFFRYTKTVDGWFTAEDRLMNFWMPAFWSGFEGQYTGLWNWVYLTHTSPDVAVACEAVRGGVTKIVTRDSWLRSEIQKTCPDMGSLVSIEVRR